MLELAVHALQLLLGVWTAALFAALVKTGMEVRRLRKLLAPPTGAAGAAEANGERQHRVSRPPRQGGTVGGGHGDRKREREL